MSQDIKRKASSELERTTQRMQAKPCTSRGTTPGTPDSVPSSERRSWRDCSTAADFFDDVAKWPSKDKDSFLLQLNHNTNPATTLADQRHSLQICLLDLASRNVQDIQRRLPSDSNIDWDAVFPKGASDESHQDNLITAWIRINRRERNAIRVYQYSLSDIDAFTKALQAVIPLRRRQQRRESHKFASKAFQIEPRTRATDGSLPSQDVFEEVRQYCTQYSDVQYLAPYTSIVGPSGIGKSYAVQSLATRHGLYVSYTSFASKLAYPSRSPVADCFPLGENTGDGEDEYARLAFLKRFFKAFIFLSLEDVLILRRLGVYSKDHFLMQINPDNQSEGDDFRNAFKEYVANSWKTFARAQDCEDLALVAHVLQKRQEDLQEILSRSDVKRHDQQGDQVQDRQNDFIVMCIDEARALLQHGTAPFRAFRQALREMWWWLAEQGKGYPRVFGLVLDTTSKISNFSPAPAHDPSQKVASDGSALNLLPTIWMLSSTDLFKSGDSRALFKKANDIRYNMGEVKELFSFGRPLWGAMMSDSSSSAESIRYVLKLAQEKTQGVDSDQLTRYLALLSYRVHFYVHRQEWAERLVSGWMRYITSIPDNRELLQTTQPSEPILAYTAARCMQNLTIRSGILGEFSTQVQRGTISVRDTGEIVAALLLLFAADAVQFRDDQMRWPQPMLLSDFTNQLLGLKKAEEITNAVHEEAEAKVSQMWRKGEVFFNHVVRRSERPTEETLRRAYRRGAALLLPHNSPGADILIPVHDPDGNKMSCFIIQVKNRISDAPTKTLRLQASADLAKAATVLSLDCPYLAMMMCLRTSPSTSPGCEILDPQNKQVQTRPPTRRLQSSTKRTPAAAKPQKSKTNNRILIITYGLDEAVYPALRHDSEQAPCTVDRLRSLLNCLPMTVVPQNEKHRIYLNGLEGL